MENTSNTAQQKKRGPKKRGYVNAHVLVSPEQLAWGYSREENFSAYVRSLIRADMERTRREAVSA